MLTAFTAGCGGLVVLECWKHLQFGITWGACLSLLARSDVEHASMFAGRKNFVNTNIVAPNLILFVV
jgi:hypothetical protein